MKTLEAKRRARADEYYKRKKYLLVRRGCGLVPRSRPVFYHLLYGIEKAAYMGEGLETRLKYREGDGGREELCIVRERERISEDLGMVIPTVKPLITDPPKSGQPLYSGRLTCPRLILP